MRVRVRVRVRVRARACVCTVCVCVCGACVWRYNGKRVVATKSSREEQKKRLVCLLLRILAACVWRMRPRTITFRPPITSPRVSLRRDASPLSQRIERKPTCWRTRGSS